MPRKVRPKRHPAKQNKPKPKKAKRPPSPEAAPPNGPDMAALAEELNEAIKTPAPWPPPTIAAELMAGAETRWPGFTEEVKKSLPWQRVKTWQDELREFNETAYNPGDPEELEVVIRLLEYKSSVAGRDAGPIEVPYQGGRPGYVAAKEIIAEYNGKSIGKALVARFDNDKLSRFVHSLPIHHMHNGRRLWIHKGDFIKAFAAHGKDLAQVEATPELVKEVIATIESAAKTWDCVACKHTMQSVKRPTTCPHCGKNAMTQRR